MTGETATRSKPKSSIDKGLAHLADRAEQRLVGLVDSGRHIPSLTAVR